MTGASNGTSRADVAVAVSFVGLVAAVVIGLFLWMQPDAASPVVIGPLPTSTVASTLVLPTAPVASARNVAGGGGASSGAVFTLHTADPNPALEMKAMKVLKSLDNTGKPPKGYLGGRVFPNDGRGGTAVLPRTDDHGRTVSYHEYDVNPNRAGVDRGPERLVVGSDSSAFCTGDHYVTWARLR